jgi:glycosyltransferase involved in cell wall biosynthesis
MLVPDEADLRRWSTSHWLEYQAWLFYHDLLTREDWSKLQRDSEALARQPPISLLTPVYNTDPEQLYECVYSVRAQAYGGWELCLVDDGSDREETLELLRALVASDERIRLRTLPTNRGICAATNSALEMASGLFVAFLDHDDRLHPAALYRVAKAINANPNIDILYSDRDMISPEGYRFMHLFKPDWSPETLLSGNYLFHLMVYRSRLVRDLGGLRKAYEGSQDFDLILRAQERDPVVEHIPRILYHWRQHGGSIADPTTNKEHVFAAGVAALRDALRRRGLSARVSEDPGPVRGRYRVELRRPESGSFRVLRFPACLHSRYFRAWLHWSAKRGDPQRHLVVLGPGLEALDADAARELVSWLELSDVGMACGKVIDAEARLLHAGLVYRCRQDPLAVYEGFPESECGYLAATAIVRNVSLAHPYCVAIRRELLQAGYGLDPGFRGPAALFDLALRAAQDGWRVVYTPYSRWRCARGWQRPEDWPDRDRELLRERWDEQYSAGDPFYNPWLSREVVDMGLDLSAPVLPPMRMDLGLQSRTASGPGSRQCG